MDGLKSVLTFCLWTGICIICVVLVGKGIWCWYCNKENGKAQKNTASWIALVVLFILQDIIPKMGVGNFWMENLINKEVSDLFFDVSSFVIKILILGAVGSTVIILLLCLYFMYKVIEMIFNKEQSGSEGLADKFVKASSKLNEVLKTPIIKYIIVWGITVIFIVLPFLMGKAYEKADLAETWKAGIFRIIDFIESDEASSEDSTDQITEGADLENGDAANNATVNETFYSAIVQYVLTFIIILGVGFATVRILYSIVNDTFANRKNRTLVEEYSTSIGVLAVGVSILWSMKRGYFFNDEPEKMMLECIKSFAAVVVIIAIGIFTLEIIRLLMDMREKIIRKEGRYVFIALVGQAGILLLEMINSIFKAMNNAIGKFEQGKMDQIQAKIKEKMIIAMQKEMEGNADKGNSIFPAFSKKITKK